MDELSKAQLRTFKALLLEQQQRLEDDLAGIEEQANTVTLDQQKVGRLSRMDALQMQSMAQANKAAAELGLQRISLALNRIQSGDYGYCLECDELISIKRLEVQPEAALCIQCQQKSEG